MQPVSSYINELRMLAGNRTDIDQVALTALNAAVATILSRDTLVAGAHFVTHDVEVAHDGLTAINLPNDLISVSAVSWAPVGATTGFKVLKYVSVEDVMVADAKTSGTPFGWSVLGGQVYFIPIITENFRVRMLGAQRFNYLTAMDQIVPIPDAHRPLCISLARSFMSVYLGEPETAAALSTLARYIDSVILSRHGSSQVLRSEGVKPYVVE